MHHLVFRLRVAVAAGLCLACLVRPGPAVAQAPTLEPIVAPAEPPPENPLLELATLEYRPVEMVEGPIRLVGSATLEQAAAFWAEGFMQIHPKAVVTLDRTSTDAGWRALLEGQAEVALLSRAITAEELAAAEREGRRPVVIAVGFDQLVWIVAAGNPVAALPWDAATGILPAGAGREPPDWSLWTSAAEQASVPVRVHGSPAGSGTRRYLDRLLGGAAGWPAPITDHDSITKVAEAVAADPGGLGLVGTAAANRPGLRSLPLEIAPGAVGEVLGSERTPDFRPLFIALATPEAGEWPAALREFVGYVLSYPGQLDLAKDALVPMARGEIHAQKEQLGWPVER
jgi:phosphate transport system substrate-binding protein